ncbi:hypothetical protein BST61_g934 [Cercospora zeina]
MQLKTFTATLALLATAVTALPESPLEKRAQTITNVQHTFYGFPDNDPPSAQTAYDCGYGRGNKAGGKGTYADPRTMATAPGEFNKCEIVWDPYTKKYLIFQDTCAQCTQDWKNRKWHIDIWTGSSTKSKSGGDAQIQCENRLTPDRGHNVVRSGNTGHEANTGPLYSASSGCQPENVFPNGN